MDSMLGTVVRSGDGSIGDTDDISSCFEGLGRITFALSNDKGCFRIPGEVGDMSEFDWLVRIEGERGAKVTFLLSVCL